MNWLNIQKDAWITAFTNKKIAGLLWLITLICGFPVMRLVHRYLYSVFGGTLVTEIWLRQFDASFLLEIISGKTPFLSLISAVFIAVLMIYGLLSVWATAGTIGWLAEPIPPGVSVNERFFSRFSHAGGKYFGPILRTSMITLSLSLLAVIFFFFGTAGIVIGIGMILLWILTSDVTKILLVRDGSRRAFITFLKSLPWVARHIHRLIPHYAVTAGVLAIGFIIYSVIDGALIADTGFKIFLLFSLQQVFVFFRGMARVQLFAAVVNVVNGRAAEPVKTAEIPLAAPVTE